jgi:multiple sugar transport system permease protein
LESTTSTQSQQPTHRSTKRAVLRSNKGKRKDYFTSFLFMVPYLIAFVLFMLWPLLYGIYISFHKWELISKNHPFIGLGNYLEIFNSETRAYTLFWEGLGNTLEFVMYSVPFLVLIGLGLALLVQALPGKLQSFFRSIYFFPMSISVAVVAVLWLWMLDTNGGLINYYLTSIGLPRIGWLSELPWAWVSIVVATIWWTVGFNMIIFQTALQEVPTSLYEAAEIDGANAWHSFIHITLPSIQNVTIFVVITSTLASFNIFGQPFLMTRGGPGRDTSVLLMNIYDRAFDQLYMGSASAMAIMLSLIMISVSVVQFRIMKSKKS